MSLQIVQQPHRDLYGVNGSTYTLLCSAITNTGNPITYTWEAPNDDGDFITLIPNSDEIIAPSNQLTVTITVQTAARAYQCRVSDSVTELVTDYTLITYAQKWYGGPTDQIIVPSQPNGLIPITQDTLIRGGFHVYESTQEMCDANKNHLRVRYGMLALVKELNAQQRIFRFNTYDPITKYINDPVYWQIGVDWVEMPVMSVDDVDNDTIKIVDNKLVAVGDGSLANVLVDDKTIQYVTSGGVEVLSATLYDQDLNTFDSVNFHDVTTNVVIENTMAIQTHTYATSSTVGRNSLSAINNSNATQGPYNVLETTSENKLYIPLDLTRANTFLLTLSDVSNPIGTYDGFVLINKAPLTSSIDVPLTANTTYQTFVEPNSLKGRIYTITLFVKHIDVMSTLPLKLYKGSVVTNADKTASEFSATQIPVKWSSGTYPALYTTPANPNWISGSEDVIMYTTYDAGATWYGFIGGTGLR